MYTENISHSAVVSSVDISDVLEIPAMSRSALMQMIIAGLPSHTLDTLQKKLNVSNSDLLKIIHMSRTTYNRRKGANLSLDESNIVIRYAQLYALALKVFESPEFANRWLSSNLAVLEGNTPLFYASTEIGATYINNILVSLDQDNFVA